MYEVLKLYFHFNERQSLKRYDLVRYTLAKVLESKV